MLCALGIENDNRDRESKLSYNQNQEETEHHDIALNYCFQSCTAFISNRVQT